MWTYEYINKSFEADCILQTLIIYKDSVFFTREVIKMFDDEDSLWIDFADSYIQFLESNL
jgi:hypothetical protein